MMGEEVLTRAAVLAGPLEEEKRAVLEILCQTAYASLESSLRDGMAPEDCREAFVTAASLQAVAALEGLTETEEIRAGDLTVKPGTRADRSRELRHQAQSLMRPYLKDNFLFAGV